MSSVGSVPRFLLPRRNPLWRIQFNNPSTLSSSSVRHASNKASKASSSKPLVLEKPTKFNPPSHGARLRKEPPKYPGPRLSDSELAAQKTKKYPNMMPPEGTFTHWFIHNKSIHMYISLGTLFVLASGVFITNFQNNSPFADMLPHWTQLFLHPIAFSRTFYEVMRLHTAHVSAETQERRTRKVEDVQKRSAYRKAHGLDKDEGIGGWMAKSDDQLLGPAMVAEGEIKEPVERKKPKKWLGIWE